MAQTDTYTNLVALIEALCGASFGTTESSRVRALVNRRAWAAYRESDYWENMLVVGEERAVNNSTTGHPILPYTGAVYDAKSGTANPYDGTIDTAMRVHSTRPWDQLSANEYEFQAVGDGIRLAGYQAAYGLAVTPTAAENATLSLGTITIGSLVDAWVGGTMRFESFADLGDDVNVWNKDHTIASVSYGASSTTITFAETFTVGSTYLAGIGTVKFPSVFVTYKKRLNGTTYGSQSGQTTAIPQEWFEYIAHGVYADMLRADQLFEAAQVEEAAAQMALQRELERLDRMHTSQLVARRLATHGTEQGRQSSYS